MSGGNFASHRRGTGAIASSSLPLTLGGVGVGGALRLRDAAHWGSWADCLEMGRARHPQVAEDVIRGMQGRVSHCLSAHGKHWQKGSDQTQRWKRGNLQRHVGGSLHVVFLVKCFWSRVHRYRAGGGRVAQPPRTCPEVF